MGRNAGNSWLDAVKKALRSPTKHMYSTKTLKARMREEDEPEVDQNKKSRKRRWIFKKTCLQETTTILHDGSNTLSTSETEPIISQADEKHAMATTSTAADEAADATVQAAVEVIRLTSPSFSFQKHKHNAALVIQTAFRAYLARIALQALKGVVKLQALVRGHNVRRRTKMTLKCMQALVRVQARVCDQRRKLSNNQGSFQDSAYSYHSNNFWGSHLVDNKSINTREESSPPNTDEWDRHASRVEEIQAMLQKTQVAGQKNRKDLTRALIHQIWRSGQNENEDLEEDRKFYLAQREPVKTVKMDSCQRCSLSPSPSSERSHNQQQRLNSNPCSSPLHHHNFHPQSPITPSSLSRIQPSVKVHSASPRCHREERSYGIPSYMSATASAMARVRPQSTPRQRMSTTDQGDKKTSARKRLSFNVSENYNGCGVSDSELDCNFRTPIHTIERRLSMSSCCKERIEGPISRPSISEERRWFR